MRSGRRHAGSWWVPVTEQELNDMTDEAVQALGKAYEIADYSKVTKSQLVARLLEAQVPTPSLEMLKAALPSMCAATQPAAADTAAEEGAQSVALAADAVETAVMATRVVGDKHVSTLEDITAEDVKGWVYAKLVRRCKELGVDTTTIEEGKKRSLRKEELQRLLIDQLGTKAVLTNC